MGLFLGYWDSYRQSSRVGLFFKCVEQKRLLGKASQPNVSKVTIHLHLQAVCILTSIKVDER